MQTSVARVPGAEVLVKDFKTIQTQMPFMEVEMMESYYEKTYRPMFDSQGFKLGELNDEVSSTCYHIPFGFCTKSC